MSLVYAVFLVSVIALIVGIAAHLTTDHQDWHNWAIGLGGVGSALSGAYLMYCRHYGLAC